jgi:heptosyltransferase III
VRLACLISARNLGDAAAHSSVLAELCDRGFAESYLVWTKPALAFLFEGIDRCEVLTSPLPVGSSNGFRPSDVRPLLRMAREVRRRAPDVTLDLVGDVRERWLARLAGSRRHLHIGWAAGHPFNRIIRNPFGRGKPAVLVSLDVPGAYAGYAAFVEAVCPRSERRTDEVVRPPAPAEARRLRIGLHPFASQDCKLWPQRSWRELAAALGSRGHELTGFCAPSEAGRLDDIFEGAGVPVRRVAGSLRNFETETAELDLMIGLDSFSVHLAQRQGVTSIMLNAGNPPTLWAPPRGTVLGCGGGCSQHPCFNVPRCDPHAEYICIRSVTVAAVVEEVDRLASLSEPAAAAAS